MSGQEITDPALIAQLEKNATSGDDAIVQALIDGRMSFPSDSRALNKPYWQSLMAKVSAADPSFDTIDYKARAKTRQDFTSGKSAQNITAFNTLLHHIGTLEQAASALDNYGGVFTPLNAGANATIEAFGSERPTNFRQAKNAVVGEAVRAFRGVGGARGDIEEAAGAIPENGSPEQIRGSLRTLASLLAGRINALGEQYSAGMGKASNGINLLDDEAQEVLGRLAGMRRDDAPDGGAALGADRPNNPGGETPTPGSNMDIGFANRSAADANSRPEGSNAYVREVTQGIRDGSITNPDELVAVANKYGASFPDRQQVVDLFEALKKGAPFGGANPLEYAIDISDDRGKSAVGDSVKAFARGIPAVVGLDDEVNAAADVVLDGGDWTQSLARERAIRNYDEDNHFWSRLGGEIVGGGGLDAGIARIAPSLTPKVAARMAGTAMLRAGGTRAEALRAANRAYALRMTQQGAGIGAVWGAGAADGDVGDRLIGAVGGGVAGGIIGGAVGVGGSRFSAALERRMQARRTAEASPAAQLADLARGQNIDVLPQDIAGPGVGRMTESFAQSPAGGGVIKRATDRLYESFRRRVDELGGKAGTTADIGTTLKRQSGELAARGTRQADETSGAIERALGTPEDLTGAGQIVQRGVSRFLDETANRAAELYRRVPIEDGADAVVESTRATLRDLTAGMRSNPELGALFENPRLVSYLNALTPRADDATGEQLSAGRLSWRDLQEFRTRIGDALDDARLSEKIAPRQLRALYGALTSDMEATARGQGENALRAWRRANTFYGARMKRVNDTLALVVGDRRDRTPNEAMTKLQGMLRAGSTDDAANFGRIMRSIPTADAQIVRATIVNDLRGGRQFNPSELARRWDQLSERGKSALLPEVGMRGMMDDAAERAAASSRDPLAGLSGEKAFLAFEALANNRGDSAEFRRRLASLSPAEATATRSLIVNRMGLATAGNQNAEGSAFSIGRFLTRWNDMTPSAKTTLFGAGELRSDMDAVAKLAEQVKASERLRNHSNTAGITITDKTGWGLATAALTFLWHPGVAALAAAPAAYQRVGAELMTSRALLRWLARAPKKPNTGAIKAHISRLERVAAAEPAIANEVLQLQARLRSAFAAPLPAQIAAEERLEGRPEPEQQRQAYHPAQRSRSLDHGQGIAR